MFSRLTRAALPALLIAAVAIAVTLVVSPQARAAVEALLSFNGVNVSVGDDGKLVVTGNTDAVVQHLRRRPRQRPEAGRLQLHQEVVQAHAQRLRPLPDLQG